MRLVFSTSDFVYAGRPRPGFPLLLDDSLEPAQPFHDYLQYRLLDAGKLLDAKTWEAYGRRLWSFADYLHKHNLQWDQPAKKGEHNAVRSFRDWQVGEKKLDPGTINDRLQIVVGMYEWAAEHQLIDHVPFSYTDILVHGVQHDLAHITGGRQVFQKPDILVDEWEKEPAFLTGEQLRVARGSIRATSQRLLFDLMARVGLRAIEARTFPCSYVFDPAARKGLKEGSVIEVKLDPRDMETKFDKPRVVHVPYSLMQDMYAYTAFERRTLELEPREELVLTSHGQPYSKDSASKIFRDLGKRLGFRIAPLMLRHSYAIHTLILLRRHPEAAVEPLMFVRDRLGHSSVQHTMVYLSQIERLLGSEALAMINEFDELYGITPASQGDAVAA